MAHRFIFSEFRQQRLDEASIEIDMGDDLVVRVPPLECWPDNVNLARSPEKGFRAILGDEAYDAYIKAGGTLRLLDAMITEAMGAKSGK